MNFDLKTSYVSYCCFSCCRQPEVYGLLAGDQFGLGFVHLIVHVTGQWPAKT